MDLEYRARAGKIVFAQRRAGLTRRVLLFLFLFYVVCFLIFISIENILYQFETQEFKRYIQQKVSFHACPSASSQEPMLPVVS